MDFNPHPSHEGWPCPFWYRPIPPYFNPHPSHEGWRVSRKVHSLPDNFNPHPSHEGWLSPSLFRSYSYSISIHILHTKDDSWLLMISTRERYFNPHPSHEGWPSVIRRESPSLWFQSTSFTRRMTNRPQRRLRSFIFQSTSFTRRMTHIQAVPANFRRFQSTSFTRRMTSLSDDDPRGFKISIHILHTKDDLRRQ